MINLETVKALRVFIVKFKYRKVQNKNVGNCTYKM